ncbi:uncharacterized protein [Typha angustifolia]|uniref:uncharacterized protein n=1 Tax=Typha angustifolia TaxID=59011 RepID=UPI003C2F7256
MGGCASKPKESNGQVPEELITETPATIEVTHKHVDVATANEIIAEPVEKAKETKEEEPLVDLSKPKTEKTLAIEVINRKVNATEITRTTTATVAAAATTTREDESSTKVDASEIKQKVVEEEKINETAISS